MQDFKARNFCILDQCTKTLVEIFNRISSFYILIIVNDLPLADLGAGATGRKAKQVLSTELSREMTENVVRVKSLFLNGSALGVHTLYRFVFLSTKFALPFKRLNSSQSIFSVHPLFLVL